MQKLNMIFLMAGVCCLAYVGAADVDCDTLPEFVNPKSCCPMPDLISDDIKDKCKEFNKQPPMDDDKTDESNTSEKRRPHPRRHNPCFMQCVFNETGIFNTNNELNEANLKAYLPIVLKNAKEMIPVVEESFKTCANRMKQFHAMMVERMQNSPPPSPKAVDRMMRPRCHHGGNMIMACVIMESVDHCVPSIWNNTSQCNNMRDFMRACMPHRQQGKQ